MKILLDECVPISIKKLILLHDIAAVLEAGWSGVKNGELLKLATTKFDAFITVDKNLGFQQNSYKIPLPVIVLHSLSNKVKYLEPLIPKVTNLLKSNLELKIYHIKSE